MREIIYTFLVLIAVFGPFLVIILVPFSLFIFFIVNLVRFLKTPKGDTEKRNKFRKAFIISLILTAVFSVVCVLLCIVYLMIGIASM